MDEKPSKDVYVLGTGLSHNGSAVILKNGQVAVAIEKERLTRKKHDGGNDSLAIQYCLDAIGITMNDISLVVQCENFVVPERDHFAGSRILKNHPEIDLHSISHHLAHAYSTLGSCPFESFNLLVIDGCGSPYEQCTENLKPSMSDLGFDLKDLSGLICEKDSFYHYDGQKMNVLFKDFSVFDPPGFNKFTLPTTKHSIGGFYAYISNYCLGSLKDAGKLMGLAPYGRHGKFKEEAFDFQNGRVLVRSDWKGMLDSPYTDYATFRENFQYYANLAFWAQQQIEKAVIYIVKSRMALNNNTALCYSGGVALNAVTNSEILKKGIAKKLYIEPAAADNGLALGCAYYGWLELLKGKRINQNGNTAFGKTYTHHQVEQAVSNLDHHWSVRSYEKNALLKETAQLISQGNTVGWFQDSCEFGPRALGRRSILASPFLKSMRNHINKNIKFREDFRPFAPAVLAEDVNRYFVHGFNSPYMILVDQVREAWKDKLTAVSHINGSARVQTVTDGWNEVFYQLLRTLKVLTGHGLVLNTSFNRRGQPIVETPNEALSLFANSALDALVIQNRIITK